MSTALQGLRVLDLSTLFSAPQISAMLGDFGADVVKVEPREGDLQRRLGVQQAGQSRLWSMVARNKRTITLDLDEAPGRALLQRLVAASDVLVVNAPQRTLERWEIPWERVSAAHPQLVMVRVSGYGATGPHAERPGAGSLGEAYAGLTHMTGEPDGPPMMTALPLGDILTAVSGLIGTLLACYARDTRGASGQLVDVSMYEPILQLLSGAFANWDGGEPPSRMGSRVAGGVPRNVYRTGDGRFVVVSGTTDPQVGRMLSLLQRDSEEDRARFAASRDRLRHADELDGLVADWIAERSRPDVIAALDAHRIPVSPVNDLQDVVTDDHVNARRNIQAFEDAILGKVHLVTPSPRLSQTPGEIQRLGAPIGAHNREVYREWLCLEGAAFETLVAEGTI